MQDAQDPDAAIIHLINQNVVRMEDCLARFRRAAGTIGERKCRYSLGTIDDQLLQPVCCFAVSGCDEYEQVAQIAPGIRSPDKFMFHDTFQ